MNESNAWREHAEKLLLAERAAVPATPLLELPMPALPGRRLVFKDESVQPTGSLKHRLARSLLLHALHDGLIDADTPLYDASSGNTAVSEAHFARLLGLRYFAVIPATTTRAKQQLIHDAGGECVLIEPGACGKQAAARLAAENDGCFLDQFTNAAVATDWRDSLVTELFAQLQDIDQPEPDWFVTGAGTGGTATSAGRYFRFARRRTRLLVVDPEDSAFFDHHACRQGGGCLCASRIEGIGRPTVEPSFDVRLVDRMARVPDAASCAAARWLSLRLGKPVGLSTGANLIGAIGLLADSRCRSVATLVCDHGDRYRERLDNAEWLSVQGLDLAPWLAALDAWHASGEWHPLAGQCCETSSRTVA